MSMMLNPWARALLAAMLWLYYPYANAQVPQKLPPRPGTTMPMAQASVPDVPKLQAKAYFLIDADTGTVIAEQKAKTLIPPASLVKVMTLYVVCNKLKQGAIKMDDKVKVSRKAWQTGGSRMFIREAQKVSVQDLIKGITIQSGNDAAVALAEHASGSTDNFVQLMNKTAAYLGMNDTHYTSATGLPHPKQLTTAYDLALLARALVHDHPEYYSWYQEKWFTFNNIKQPNRNRLLWRMSGVVDGIKTGHTDKGGFCLMASGQQNGMRLVGITLGSPSDATRAADAKKLMRYGFLYYQQHQLYQAKQELARPSLWAGQHNDVACGISQDIRLTLAKGQYDNLRAKMLLPEQLQAPIAKGDKLGSLQILLNDKVLEEHDLIALEDVALGHFAKRWFDKLKLSLSGWFEGEPASS